MVDFWQSGENYIAVEHVCFKGVDFRGKVKVVHYKSFIKVRLLESTVFFTMPQKL